MTKPVIRFNTAAEEAGLQRQIAVGPDTWEAPADARIIRRGRPAGATKEQVTVRIDKDVLAILKGEDEKGWQTRLNAALRKAVGL